MLVKALHCCVAALDSSNASAPLEEAAAIRTLCSWSAAVAVPLPCKCQQCRSRRRRGWGSVLFVFRLLLPPFCPVPEKLPLQIFRNEIGRQLSRQYNATRPPRFQNISFPSLLYLLVSLYCNRESEISSPDGALSRSVRYSSPENSEKKTRPPQFL